MYVIQCKEDLREYLYDLIKQDEVLCSIHFDKWNNSLLIEASHNTAYNNHEN